MINKNRTLRDYNRERVSKYICRLTNKYTDVEKFEAVITINTRRYCKYADSLKEAEKFIDFKCLEHKLPQVFNSYKKN